MNARRQATLRRVVETFAPSDARFDRVTALATAAIDSVSPGRRADFERLLDLLELPMRAGDETRARTLRFFANSPVALLRSGFAALKRLVAYLSYAESDPALAPNPTWARIGYPGPRDDRGASDPRLPFAEAAQGERVVADVVVIGSGAGGGVAASAFARAGKRVVVLEAGGAYDADAITQRELAMSDLYLDAGLTSTKDLGVTVLAGATLGGGTTVNWCTSFRLPDRVAAEWESESGIASLGSELAPHYAALTERLALAPVNVHNRNNRCILDGARALGLHADAMPRNAPADCGDGCGYCGFGCAYGKKRSTARAFLPDLTENGGAVYVRARAIAIELSGERATGVRVEQTLENGTIHFFTVAAETVVVAAGALRTPGLLARSGIRHPLLGQRLYLHPVSALMCRYEDEIDAFSGPMQSAYSDAFANLHGNYGAKIEAAPAHPGLSALVIPWESRAQHAEIMNGVRHVASLVAVVRDRDPGAIDLDDEAQIRYSVSPFDGEHLLAGLVGMADLAFAGGAVEIATLHATPIRIERDAWTPSRRAEFVERLERIGIASNRQPFFSAHQMGTACMGASPATSVVDPSGRVWGFDNLLVVDASLFPQSSGVNPMLTIMAMASRVAAQHGGAFTPAGTPKETVTAGPGR
jgi:choline dehydrogenase-like flavoprotein